MTDLTPGDTAPDFTAPRDGGGFFTLSDYTKDRAVILYFYPKDDTPGCTKEACGFNEALPQFGALDAIVVGVSKDSAARHDLFRDKYDLAFPLVSDEDGAICEAYGTWVEKSMYGKKYMGIDRATFLIARGGRIAQIWRKVKVPGHVEDVRKALEAL